MNTTYTGKAVKSGGGRFIHIAANETRTVCGKPITSLYAEDARRADCWVCERRAPRR